MNTRKTLRPLMAGVLMAGGLLLAGALQAPASAQDVDSRWLPWLGCWETAEGGAEAPLLCVRPLPDGQGVEMTTWSEGELVSSEVMIADGVPREVDREGCRGMEQAWFSGDGRRVYMDSEYVCEGESPWAAKGVLAMVNPMEWVDVKVVEVSGQRMPWTLRYRMARASRAAEVGMEDVVAARAMAVRGARMEASAPLMEDHLVEVVGEVGPEALQALLVERGDRFGVDAGMLVRLADAGVPGAVIDVLVALSYPDRFVVDAGDVEELERARTYAGYPMPYAGPYRRPFWSPFFYDPFYYGYGGYGMYGFGGHWGYYRPTTIIVQPRRPETGPVNQMIRGSGYTRGGSRQPAPSSGADRSSVGTVSSGGSGAASSTRGSGSSGSTTRRAIPRGGGSSGGGG